MILGMFSIFSFLISLTSADVIASDYCVGDLSLPSGPQGYSCNDPTKTVVDDFVYSGLHPVGSFSDNPFKFRASFASVTQFPGLNGMKLSIARAEMDVGGVIPLHSHRVSELLLVSEGKILAGFIDTNNTAYYKVLNKGDIMIIPPTLLHFQVNVGTIPSAIYASFASENPGLQVFDNALFQNNLPTELIEKITLLDAAQVKKLKNVFGGTN